jgi:hypothetical protein
MNKKSLLIIIFLVVLNVLILFFRNYHSLFTVHRSSVIEEVLRQAGGNRGELEKVLDHYSRHPADSLKLRAAEFLILNMPDKYSVGYDAPWEDIATVSLRWTSSLNKQLVLDTYNLGDQTVRDDLRCITAEYLINNIELAFKVWRETPWGKHISFDAFCEDILPYRVNVEPLENWREKVLAGFAELYDELKNDSSMTAVQACCKVNSMLPGGFSIDKDFPPMNYSMLMASMRNTCSGMSALAIFSMRAMGIPVTYDYTIQYPHSSTGHSWNSVRDSAGNYISFMGVQSNPGESHKVIEVPLSKAYRKMFSHQNPVQTENAHIPPELQERCIKDISDEYAGHINIEVAASFQPEINTGYAYLATLLFNANGLKWNPVAWGKTANQHIHYDLVEKNIVYLPVYYVNNQQTPAGYPFFLDDDGNIQYFKPDVASTHEYVFYESGTPSGNGAPAKVIRGKTYELQYWNGANWQLLGKKVAKDASVSFRVPDNALLYLRTDDRNDNFPVFCIRNDKQHWLFK